MLLLAMLPGEIQSGPATLSAAILALFVFGLSVISAMLHKIIPFLVWLHLTLTVTERKLSRKLVPNVKEIIPAHATGLQLAAHTLAMSLVVAAPLQPRYLTAAAGLVFFASNLLLLRNVLIGVRVHRDKLLEIGVFRS